VLDTDYADANDYKYIKWDAMWKKMQEKLTAAGEGTL
jgi:hypothetical protein